MENKKEKRIYIKKIIAEISCVLIISSVLIISCFASLSSYPVNNVYYRFDNILSGTGSSGTLQISGKYLDIANNTETEYAEIQIAYQNQNLYDVILQTSDHAVVKIISNSNKDNIAVMFYNIESMSNNIKQIFANNITQYVPPADPYTPTADFLTWILNDTTTILGFMISNSVMLLVISIVIVSLAIGVIKRLTNKKF